MQSKAEIRSVATMSRRSSSTAYTSRTLPRRTSSRSAKEVWLTGERALMSFCFVGGRLEVMRHQPRTWPRDCARAILVCQDKEIEPVILAGTQPADVK